ncbi:hypothetical protein T4D_12708 [Trichinella pseudospiralis]|uniref:Uncharacterized protein n=1 Tax=Trichinella pseudospiralis TaxID=6337 RepID=A0A0V1DRU8_TRIPS|nr:hypothetical protein T4D_12708 [Trichinella pseudospiralis]
MSLTIETKGHSKLNEEKDGHGTPFHEMSAM